MQLSFYTDKISLRISSENHKVNIIIPPLSRRNQMLSVAFHPFSLCLLLSDYKQKVAGWVLAAGLHKRSISHRPPLATDLLVSFPPLVQLDTLWFHVHAALMCSHTDQNVAFRRFWFPANRRARHNRQGSRLMGGSVHSCPDRTPETLVSNFLPKAQLDSESIMIHPLYTKKSLQPQSYAGLITSAGAP